jgi:hypothetical protein
MRNGSSTTWPALTRVAPARARRKKTANDAKQGEGNLQNHGLGNCRATMQISPDLQQQAGARNPRGQ